jgi:predicted ester cyclase
MSTVEHLSRLWAQPLPAGADAVAAFGELYTDPVRINGSDVPLTGLVERARGLQRAFDGLRMELLDVVETPDRLVIAFLQRARHVGPLELPLGPVAATGRDIEVRTIDVLTMRDGRISEIQVVSDQLGLAMQLGAVTLTPAR